MGQLSAPAALSSKRGVERKAHISNLLGASLEYALAGEVVCSVELGQLRSTFFNRRERTYSNAP